MTIVEGQIDSLRKLKVVLNQNGITRFNSIGEINNFIKNYDIEKNKISEDVEHALDLEIEDLQSDLIKFQQVSDKLKTETTKNLNTKIEKLKGKLRLAQEKNEISTIKKVFYFPQLTIFKFRISKLEKNFEKIVSRKTRAAELDLNKTKNKVEDYSENRGKIIVDRSLPLYKKLAFTKGVVDGLYTVIAGAIGESLVVKKLQKLSDNYYLFNDYSIKFDTPIFNRKENDRIYSIQIDHLLVANSGIFILETKNWSKQSIKNLDLRSPIKQIMRTSYALFVLLNSKSKYNNIKLKSHHWGNKQIPIRSIIVMIHEKPKELFKYVKVKTLKELNGYITYYESIFNDAEVKSISDYLRISRVGVS